MSTPTTQELLDEVQTQLLEHIRAGFVSRLQTAEGHQTEWDLSLIIRLRDKLRREVASASEIRTLVQFARPGSGA